MSLRDKLNYYRIPVFQAPDAPSGSAPSAPSDSGTSAPSSAPSTPTPDASSPSTLTSSPTTESSGDGASSFEFMFDSTGGDPLNGPSDSGLSPPTVASPAPVPAQTAPAPAATPAATATEPGKQPTTATPAPTEAASPTQPTAEGGAQPNLDPYDPGTLAAHLAQNEEQVVQHVADSLFKLSDKDVEELESNAVAAIPKLLARSFVSAQRNFLMQLANLVPRMIQTHGEVTKRHTEAEGEFYSRWPDLKKDQEITVAGKPTTVNKLVMQYASVYRQMNPQASRKDAIEYVGPMVMMAAGVQPSVQPSAPATGPTASPMSNGVRSPQPTPFSPAGALAGGAVPTTRPELTPVEAMFPPE